MEDALRLYFLGFYAVSVLVFRIGSILQQNLNNFSVAAGCCHV